MFGLGEGYAIAKITIKEDNPLNEKPIRELKSLLEGVLILAIYRREGKKIQFIGAPHGEVIIKTDDELICYAKEDAIAKSFSAA